MSDEDSKDRLNQYLTWVFALILVSLIVIVAFLAMNPWLTTEPYTGFYILGPEGEATGYPSKFAPGETGTVIVGISNHEHQAKDYRVEVAWNQTTTLQREIRVERNASAEFRATVTAPNEPGRYRLRFLLYKNSDPSSAPDHSLRLWVRVQ